jgi:hypothetical protein
MYLVWELNTVAHVQHNEWAGEAVLEVTIVSRVEAAPTVLDVVDKLETVVHDRRHLYVYAEIVVFMTMVYFVVWTT